MNKKKQLLEGQEAGKHTLVGDLYTRTTAAITAAPLVGSAISATTGLVKTTLGGVKDVTQRVGLKKYDVSSDGVVKKQWYETKEWQSFGKRSLIISFIIGTLAAIAVAFYKYIWPMLHPAPGQYGDQVDDKNDIETTQQNNPGGTALQSYKDNAPNHGSTLKIPVDLPFGS